MGGIEAFVILPVATFYFAIVSWGKGTDDFVADPVCFQMFLEKGRLFSVCGKAICKFCAIICLDTFNGTGKGLSTN